MLAAVGEQPGDGAAGAVERRTEVHVDAHDELADVDGTEVFWDSAAPYASGLVQAGGTSVVGAGPMTGVASDDAAGDPWGVGAGVALPTTRRSRTRPAT